MVIAAKTKPRQTIHHKKRTGQHQRQTKHYMKTYWPYLPMIAAAAFVNSILAGMSSPTFATASAENTTRIEAWTNAGPWLTVLIVTLGVACITVVIARHTLAWQRAIVKSEQFFVKHHTLDVFLFGVVLTGIILTRTV